MASVFLAENGHLQFIPSTQTDQHLTCLDIWPFCFRDGLLGHLKVKMGNHGRSKDGNPRFTRLYSIRRLCAPVTLLN